ncbi:hypothetical protein [Mucilaginibacter polytrichastri]|uniref:Polysaccharide biosynthesis protein C-terminal domain-containing protein n=1 Tax=Mucilaginibacter polytrichastri TaxID=1302689 RepID=A0A1Q6A387_9SPHI|nr:hypothetical protein [Mucilaginibacter polytrichastri]OKS88468.1 hypothetical protein RG47T_3935 [Mucilaginibacter polytrichastri]SFT12309.1 hypothetical protein SAMN04487890_111156 [Mucilaginibacter polytrichastri]
MLKKLGSITVLSSLGALLNFFTTFIIVHKLGLGVLGQFTIVNSITGLCSLIYTILPPNYSIFKYQDDSDYKFILSAFYIVATAPFILILYIAYLFHSFSGLSFSIIVFNGLTTIGFYYYDIVYQATNRLYRYFTQLLLQAAIKIILMYAFYYMHILKDTTSLILATSFAQLICLILYANDFIKNVNFSFKYVAGPVKHTYYSINKLKSYYLNAVIKRVKDNIIIVLFSNILTADLLGLYTLFIKITSFVLSLGRSFEAFFANRENMEKYHTSFSKKIFLLGACLQAVFLSVGLIYMKIYTHNFYTLEIAILSLLVYPYSRFIVERMRFLGSYNNRELNISMFFYIAFVLISFGICKVFNYTSLHTILLVYLLSELMNFTHLIYKSIVDKSRLVKAI